MRIRRVASEKDSGLEKVERSASSGQGRRSERLLRRESLRRERKARNAEMATGGWVSTGWLTEIGREGGTEADIATDYRSLENGKMLSVRYFFLFGGWI